MDYKILYPDPVTIGEPFKLLSNYYNYIKSIISIINGTMLKH